MTEEKEICNLGAECNLTYGGGVIISFIHGRVYGVDGSVCTDCKFVAHSEKEMFDHRCPTQTKIGHEPVKITLKQVFAALNDFDNSHPDSDKLKNTLTLLRQLRDQEREPTTTDRPDNGSTHPSQEDPQAGKATADGGKGEIV